MALERTSCCGLRKPRLEDGNIEWDRYTHAAVVRRGADLLGAIRDSYVVARVFTDVLWNDGGFSSAVYRGLSDADDLNPWADPRMAGVVGPNLYAYHFCDASSLQTHKFFFGLPYEFDFYSAISEGERSFNLAVHAGRRALRHLDRAPAADIVAAAHYLGLSLHFLTDLTQPMHAANFANVLGAEDETKNSEDYRHAAFEARAEDLAQEVLKDVAPLDPQKLRTETEGWASAGHVFLATAQAAKRIWTNGLAAYAKSKPRTQAPWDDGGADGYAKEALQQAPLAVARLLALWTAQIRTDLEDYGLVGGTVYQPTLPTHPKQCLYNEMAVQLGTKATSGKPPVKELTTLTYNDDGTASFLALGDWWWSSERGTLHLTASTTDPARWFRLHTAETANRQANHVSVYIGQPIRVSDTAIDEYGDKILKIDAPHAQTVFADYPELGAVRPTGRGPDLQRWSFPVASEIAPKIDAKTSTPSCGWARGPRQWEAWKKVEGAVFANAYPGIAVTRRAGDHLDVFTNGGGKLQRREWYGAWNALPEVAPSGGTTSGRFTAASYGPQQLAVFTMLTQNGQTDLYHLYLDGSASGWTKHEYPSTSRNDAVHFLSAAGWKDAVVLYAVVGTQLRMREWKRSTNAWTPWTTVQSGARAGVAATVVLRPGRHAVGGAGLLDRGRQAPPGAAHGRDDLGGAAVGRPPGQLRRSSAHRQRVAVERRHGRIHRRRRRAPPALPLHTLGRTVQRLDADPVGRQVRAHERHQRRAVAGATRSLRARHHGAIVAEGVALSLNRW